MVVGVFFSLLPPASLLAFYLPPICFSELSVTLRFTLLANKTTTETTNHIKAQCEILIVEEAQNLTKLVD